MKNYTCFSPRASLAFVGRMSTKMKIWVPLRQRVQLKQKKRKYDPLDKLKMAWVNILSGGGGIVEVNTRVRSDRGLQKAFGLRECAEQSTVSRSLKACTSDNVTEMRQAMQDIFQQHSLSYQHPYEKCLQVLDVDITGLLAGRLGEGVTKGFFSGARNGRGRQVGRVKASLYDEIVTDRLYPGKVQLERSLQELVTTAEGGLALNEERRKCTLVRVDGGGGRDADINWLLNRNYRVLIKVKNWQRTRKLLERVQTWFPDPKDPLRNLGWVEPGFAYARPTRQIGIRETHADGKTYQYVLVCNLSDEQLFTQNGLSPDTQPTPAEVLSLGANLYDLRSGGVETANRNSKSGLGLNKRNQAKFAAQEMLVLLAQLAYNLLSWLHRLLRQPPSPFCHYGWQRLVRDVFHIPGRMVFDPQNQLIAIHLSRDHPLSKPFVEVISTSAPVDHLSLILRKI